MITFSGHLSPNKLSVKIMTQLKISIFLLPTQGEGFCVPEGSLHTEKTLAERKATRSFSSVSPIHLIPILCPRDFRGGKACWLCSLESKKNGP